MWFAQIAVWYREAASPDRIFDGLPVGQAKHKGNEIYFGGIRWKNY